MAVGNMLGNVVKFGRVVFEICSPTNMADKHERSFRRQTDRQATNTLNTIFRSPFKVRVISRVQLSDVSVQRPLSAYRFHNPQQLTQS